MTVRESVPDARPRALGFRHALEALVLLAGWTSGVHLAVVGVRRLVLDGFVWQSRDVAWMAPLGYLMTLAAVLMPAWLLHRAAARWISPVVPLFVASWAAAVAIVLWMTSLHPVAVLLLGAGAGWQLSQTLWRGGRGLRVMRVGATAVAMAIIPASLAGVRSARERAPGAGTDSPPDDAPSVLVIILDTVRAASLSLHGYDRPQPTIDALAADGVVFQRAIAPSSWTLPSHASMFTGRPAHELGASWRTPLSDTSPTIAEAFATAGYRTAGFSANHFYAAYETGLARGFALWRDYERSVRQVLLSTTLAQIPLAAELARAGGPAAMFTALRRFELRLNVSFSSDPTPASLVVDRFLEWRTATPGPHFAFLNLYDAHEPYDSPPAYSTRYGDAPRDRYDGAIAYIDSELARLVRQLEADGSLDRTIIVLASDHGQLFGEHGVHGHGNSLYDEVLRVPLIIRYPPSVPRGTRVGRVVSLTALPATLLELAQVPDPRFHGQVSLAGLWKEGPVPLSSAQASVRWSRHLTDPSPLQQGDMHAVADDSLLVIRDGRNAIEAFVHRGGAVEAADPTSPSVQALRALLPTLHSQASKAGR